MSKSSPFLTWCVIRIGEDSNWWVQETSDPIHWDVDALSIIDPRQINHIIDLMDPLREYGLLPEIVDAAFYCFEIDEDLGAGKIKLKSTNNSFIESEEEKLFALPDILDDEKGPYADLLDHITKLRVQMLNDLIEMEQPLTVEDVEDELREIQNNDFMEGRCTHVFNELCDILEYVPAGFELDTEDDNRITIHEGNDLGDDIPDFEEDNENIEEDETMRWDDEREGDGEEEEEEAVAAAATPKRGRPSKKK